VLPFLIQILLFATPIIYPASMVPERFRWITAINPLSALVEGFRHMVMPGRAIDWPLLGISALSIAVVFVAGVSYFKSTEKAMADVV
jgi:lipopolysaccharide transport system permease protein